MATPRRPAEHVDGTGKCRTSATKPDGAVPDQGVAVNAFQWNVHGYVNDYIRYADTKAALVMAYGSAMIGVLYARGAHRAFAHHPVGSWHWRACLSVSAFALLAASIVLAASSVMPRLRSYGEPGLIFWDDVRKHHNSADYVRSLYSKSSKELTDQVSKHIFVLAGLAKRKFRVVGWSCWTAVAGSASGALLLIFQ